MRLVGGNGHDVLNGYYGDDVLIGGEGDDVVKGGKGNDILIRGPGVDKLDGGAGLNRIIDYAAFIAGTVPGMPLPPVSMLDWLPPMSVGTPPGGDCSKPKKGAEPQITLIEWSGTPLNNAGWGIPFQRNLAVSNIAEPWADSGSDNGLLGQLKIDIEGAQSDRKNS